MADIFVSYARADKARVAPLVAALEAQGWSVWWDPEITPGQEFDSLIRREINAARAVIVVWTQSSVDSRWVRGEARLGAERGILVPVRFDTAQLPIDALSLHTTDLDDWKEDRQSRPFQDLARALSKLVVAPAPAVFSSAPVRDTKPEESSRSICVLPFVNMSGDPEQEYFSDGLSEELLNQLAQMKGLKVAARTSCFAFKGQTPDLKVVGEKLGVAHVLEGSVRKAGNRLRITAQLIKAADGYHLWSNTFNRELDDVFQIQEDIARAVADALKITLGMNESTLPAGGTTNVEAYDLYLRGRAQLAQVSAQGTQRSVALLRQAVELDPRFYLAWALLAGAYANAMVFNHETEEISRQLHDEACERAKACAPEPWMSHDAVAAQFLMKRDWLAAQAAYDKARELASSGSVLEMGAYFYFLNNVGRASESIEGMRQIVRNDPQAPSPVLPFMLDCLGRHDEAEAEYRRQRSLPLDPLVPEYWALLRTMAREGSQTVKVQLGRFIAFVPSDGAFLLKEVLAKFDDRKAVLALLRKSFEEPFNQNPFGMIRLAQWAAYFGDDELALACLRGACVERRLLTLYMIWHPLFVSARRAEGFKEIVRDLGIADYWRQSGHWGDFARPLGDDDFEVFR